MRKFILGTDWWTDCDDAVAIRMLSRAHRRGEIELVGIGMNACMPYSVSSLRGFMEAEGIGNVPLGIDLDATDFGGNPPYQKNMSEYFNNRYTNADALDAVELYRRLLRESDGKVEIIEIGYPQVLASVIESEPKLFAEKVEKVWIMAGKWDKDGERENNFCRNARASVAAEKLCRLCPVPMTFLGWEIGIDVLTGGNLPDEDYLHRALVDHGSGAGRCSWDPMLVLIALIGDEERAGYDSHVGYATIDAADGSNYFRHDCNGMHKFVTKKFDNSYYENAINSLIN